SDGIVSAAEAVPATADDDDVVLARRLGGVQGRSPAGMVAQALAAQAKGQGSFRQAGPSSAAVVHHGDASGVGRPEPRHAPGISAHLWVHGAIARGSELPLTFPPVPISLRRKQVLGESMTEPVAV